MLRTAILVPMVYVVGGVALTWLGWSRLVSDDPNRDIALWIVLPVAWWVSFLPTAASLLAVFRVRQVFRKLEELHEKIRTGNVCDRSVEEQVEYWTDLVALENRVPRFMIRAFVRRVVEHLIAEASAADGPVESPAGGQPAAPEAEPDHASTP